MNSAPSAIWNVTRGLEPRWRWATATTFASVSTVSRREFESIPASSHVVPCPVPVPSSRSRPPGFDAARAESNAPTFGSELMLKPRAFVSFRIASIAAGVRLMSRSFIPVVLGSPLLVKVGRPTLPRLPDPHTLVWRAIHLVARHDAKRLIEPVDVRWRITTAIWRGGGRVRGHQDAHRFFAPLPPPGRRPADEHALLAGESVDLRRRLAGQRHFVRLECDRESSKVADVLAKREAAIHVQSGERFKRIELFDQHLGAFSELLVIRLGPPVAQPSVAVVVASLVVKTMTDLVANDGANPPVIHRIVCFEGKKRRLQDRRRKDDLVLNRVVVGVHFLWRHQPERSIDGPAELRDLKIRFEFCRSLRISYQVVVLDGETGVASELIGVADLRREFRKLGERFLFGIRCHPIKRGDRLPVGFDQIRHHRLHPSFRRGWEMLLAVQFTDRFGHPVLHEGDAALPSLALLRLPVERAAKEFEVRINNRLAEEATLRGDDLRAQPCFPDVERCLRRERPDSGKK